MELHQFECQLPYVEMPEVLPEEETVGLMKKPFKMNLKNEKLAGRGASNPHVRIRARYHGTLKPPMYPASPLFFEIYGKDVPGDALQQHTKTNPAIPIKKLTENPRTPVVAGLLATNPYKEFLVFFSQSAISHSLAFLAFR